VPTLDEEIARHLQEALASGELKGCEYFGKPLPDCACCTNSAPSSARSRCAWRACASAAASERRPVPHPEGLP